MDLLTIVSTLVAALIAAVTAMWKKLAADHARLSRRSDECEEDRAKIHEKLDEHGRALAVYAACPASECPARTGLQRAAATFNLKQ